MMDNHDDGGFIEEQEEQEEERTEEKVINEEYKTWKKNAPFLYDMILSTALEWPTLTTQWLPDKQDVPDKPYSTHRLLLGTHTSSEAQNYLQIAHVQLPNPTTPNPDDYDEERGEVGGYGGSSKRAPMEIKFNIVQKIDHKGEVNKARYQPQNPNIIATMCTDGRVMIWDRSKHPSLPTGTVNPQMELLGHTREGFGLSWSPHTAGHLVTGSEDKTVRLWDLTTYTKGNKALKPVKTYTHHSSIVNDVQYHPLHSSLIGTVSDDITLQILDTREPDTTRAAASSEGQHRDAINSVAFNPAAETVLATGSADKSIGLWDLRNLKTRLHTLESHADSVTSLSWHPFEESVLASASYDRKIIFWDLSRAGEEQTPEDAQDGPPELFETREIAEDVLAEFHNTVGKDGVKLLLRFADTKAQKVLKHQSNERRAYRAGEYNYSVEVVQGSTPSPSLYRLQQTASHLSPNSQVSYTSPVGVGSTWTPATSISPSCAIAKNPINGRLDSWSSRNSRANPENTPVYRGSVSSANRSTMADTMSAASSKTVAPNSPCEEPSSLASSPRKENAKAGSLSPVSCHKEIFVDTPRSSI